jgi:hypothetical protein
MIKPSLHGWSAIQELRRIMITCYFTIILLILTIFYNLSKWSEVYPIATNFVVLFFGSGCLMVDGRQPIVSGPSGVSRLF